MATVCVEAMQKLINDWPTVDQILDMPDFLRDFGWSRHYFLCDPWTDDMRQMMDDLGIEPGLAVERIPASSIFIGVDYGIDVSAESYTVEITGEVVRRA